MSDQSCQNLTGQHYLQQHQHNIQINNNLSNITASSQGFDFNNPFASNFMGYNPFMQTHSNFLPSSNPCSNTSQVSSLPYNSGAVSSMISNEPSQSQASPGSNGDHRSSSIATLRLKAREHSVALGTI